MPSAKFVNPKNGDQIVGRQCKNVYIYCLLFTYSLLIKISLFKWLFVTLILVIS